MKTLLAIITAFSMGAHAIDHGPASPYLEFLPMTPEQLRLSNQVEFFLSENNYEASGGSYESLPNGGKFTALVNLITATYDLNSTFRLLSQGRISYVSTDDGGFSRTNSEFTDVSLGAELSLIEAVSLRLIATGIGTFALNEIDPKTDDAITGEGVNNGFLALKSIYDLPTVQLHGQLGFRFMTEGRSHRIPWRLGATWEFIRKFKIHGALFGFQSISDDEDTDLPTVKINVTRRVNAGSQRYYAVNPSVIDSMVGFDLEFGELSFLSFGVTKTLNGESFSEGIGAYLNYSLIWGGVEDILEVDQSSEVRKRKKKRLRKWKPKEEFKSKTENYNEELFYDEENQRKKKRKKRKRRRKKKPNLDKEINDAIDSLE